MIAGVKNDADDDDHDRVRIAVARATLNDFAWDVMIIMKTDQVNTTIAELGGHARVCIILRRAHRLQCGGIRGGDA